MKTKLFLLALVVLFTSSIYAQGYRIEKVGNDTIATKVGELIDEIPYFDSLPILIEQYGIEKVTEAWIYGESKIYLSPVIISHHWLPKQTNQKRTIHLIKKDEKIDSRTVSTPPITSWDLIVLVICFLLGVLGFVLGKGTVLSKLRRKDYRQTVFFFWIGVTIAASFSVIAFGFSPLYCLVLGIIMGILIGVNHIKKSTQEKPPE